MQVFFQINYKIIKILLTLQKYPVIIILSLEKVTWSWRNTQVRLKGLVLKTRRSETARGFESLFLRHLYVLFIAGWSSGSSLGS